MSQGNAIPSNYQLAGGQGEMHTLEQKIEKLQFIIEGVTDEQCKKALELSNYDLNGAAERLLNGNHDPESQDSDGKEKITISQRIKDEFGGSLNFFEISQVLLMCNNNEEDAIEILKTMV
ncbi:hypothetical protein GPJ56_008155 [Histomonas meleagridis]|uniref:uncharacterized protein n=1 Tax=Histomonas meleagridis TaxID=135588 RepID=UPI00355AB3A4|nr:hypothetical protein GPJ56_008155 [Histomonas meleagridis]KAH0803105.1 hypothetical protein GO595_004198 [Histomonas meleagridis]